MDRLWVTWEDHRRSRELANHFGARLRVLESPLPRPARYFVLSLRTLALLLVQRPRVVFCQNPSIVLAAWLVLWRPICRYRLVVDRHSNFKFETAGRPELKWRVFHALSRFTLRRADLTVVTNEPLRRLVDDAGGRGFVLQDKLPELRPSGVAPAARDRSVVFVCTFAEDEPVAEVLAAAARLGPDCRLLVTGNREKFERNFRLEIPANVTLTGFLPEQEYVDLVAGAGAVLVLTDTDLLLNCAAYEAVALGRPMVLSDTPTIRGYFRRGARYVALDPESIAAGIAGIFADHERYMEEVRLLRDELRIDWRGRAADLEARLGSV